MKVSNDALTERVYSNPGDKKITFQRQAKITEYFQKEYNKVVSLANINMAANKKRKTAYGRKWEYVKYDCQ